MMRALDRQACELPKKRNPKDGATSKGQAANGLAKGPRQQYRKRRSNRKRQSCQFDIDGRAVQLTGQSACALASLVMAGGAGITALEMSSWALRLGAYVHILRRDYGLNIETLREPHNDHGDTHGRYVLHSRVTIKGAA